MLSVYKPQGLSPLQAITLLKKQQPELTETTISYAGRLDPMAEGLLLLLVGKENKDRQAFEALEKTYRFDILLGVSTDTYDLLGLITNQSQTTTLPRTPQIEKVLPSFIGTHSQPYPPYPSKPVNGKPLYFWAREGRMNEIVIPEKTVTITSLVLLKTQSLSPFDLEKNIFERIQRVSGDFRQDAIISSWQSFFKSPTLPDSFPLHTCEITCSSGTYVRSVAHTLGEKLGCGALAYSITRTRIGEFSLENARILEPIAY